MPLTLLLDLDDTLLDTNVPVFTPAYFQALASQPFRGIAMEKFAPAMSEATRLMYQSADPSHTMQNVFDSFFYPRVQISKDDVQSKIEQFYDEFFPTLGSLTSARPEAVKFVEWATLKGYRIAIATDPLLPWKATHQRLRWAGLDPDQFELITTYEEFHFSKTFPAYYAEVLARLGWPYGPVLMVGNDLERDIAPARALGLATYHLVIDPAQKSGGEANGSGNFAELRAWLESTDMSALEPVFESMESLRSVLMSTPAALSSIMHSTSSPDARPAQGEWALVEILCHFRDTEKEIHFEHITRALNDDDPFLSSPDTHDWADRRGYLKQNPYEALADFTNTRLQILKVINEIKPADLDRRSRHAVFGPTTLKELIEFMVEHDRLHLNQVWKLLNPERH